MRACQIAVLSVAALAIGLYGQNGLQIPARPEALFKSEQGKQNTEIHFDPATGMVTLKVPVQDSAGYLIPSLHRNNFAVYENDVLQHNVTVEIEHPPVTIGLLLEAGGRYPSLNRIIREQVSRAGRQLVDVLGREDKVTVFKYADTVEQLTPVSAVSEDSDRIFLELKVPSVSEANLYDAIAATLSRLRPLPGRKALVLVSSGIDTFSKLTYEDLLQSARNSGVPIYVVGLGSAISQAMTLATTLDGATSASSPGSGADQWAQAERRLSEIARVSGGRAYFPDSTLNLSAIYDDLIENLKVRYVITYKSSHSGDLSTPRKVRVSLVDPKTGGPLDIVDSNRKKIRANVIEDQTYVPALAAKTHER